jgi:ketosteroid isomerase-like protein
MSQENVELVKALQPSGIDLVEVFGQEFESQMADDQDAGLFHRDLEVQFIARGQKLEGVVYRGLEGLAQAWREWLAAWSSYRLDVDELVDVGDKVVVFVRVEARTVRDDVLMHHTPGAIWTIRAGKVASIRFYFDRDEALDSVGLSEEDAHADS